MWTKWKSNVLLKRSLTLSGPRYNLRARVIARILDKYFIKNFHTGLELGSGMGDISDFILKKNEIRSWSVCDFSPTALSHLRDRFKDDARVKHLDKLEKASFDNDILLCFEVIEHVADDVSLLKQMRELLSASGVIVLSVPIYMSKWQKQDEWAGHYRRYEFDEIEKKIQFG